MQSIDRFSFPKFPQDISSNDPFVNKIIELVSKIGNKSFKTENEKIKAINQFLRFLPYHLCPQQKRPQYIEYINELVLNQFPKFQDIQSSEKTLEDACLDESDFKSLQHSSKNLCLFDIKIKIIQALTKSYNPDQALDLWLGEFSECLETSDKFSYLFLEVGKDLFLALISKTQLNEALILLSYLSMAEEITSRETLEYFSLLCQILKQEDHKFAIQEEDQDRFELIAKNLAKKNLSHKHKGLRRLIDSLLAMGKQQTVDLILHSHLTQLKTFEGFEQFSIKKPALLKHYYAASLKLEDPSLAIDLFIALSNNTKLPLNELDFFQFYEQILQKLKINEKTLPLIEKILSHRIATAFDLNEIVDLPFINAILTHMNSSNFSHVYFQCWQFLCKVLKNETEVPDNFYKTIHLFFKKRTVFKNKSISKNYITKILKEKYLSFLRDIKKVNDNKLNILLKINEIIGDSQLFNKSESSAHHQEILEKSDHFQKTSNNFETNLKIAEEKPPLISKEKIITRFSYLIQALEEFKKHQDPERLNSDIDSIWKIPNESYLETLTFFEEIYELYLKHPKENHSLFPCLIEKINAIIDSANFNSEQKISFFHLFIYLYHDYFELDSDTSHKFFNIFSKLNENIKLKALFPERYWEFNLLLNPKVDITENLRAAKQGLFFAIKSLVTDHKASSPTNFKTALGLFKHLDHFSNSIHNIRKIYHIFFKNFNKSIFSYLNTNTNKEELLFILLKLSFQLNQTIEYLITSKSSNSELGSLLISEFVGLLISANKNNLFSDQAFFELLDNILILSNSWIEHNREILPYQLPYGKIFEDLLNHLKDKDYNDDKSNLLINELENHVLFFNNIDTNKKIAVTEILERFNELSLENSNRQDTKNVDAKLEYSKLKLELSSNIENQLLSKFASLNPEQKNFNSQLIQLLNFFKTHKICSLQHIDTLFKFVTQSKREDLKLLALNFFHTMNVYNEDEMDPITSFHYVNIWKTILKDNFPKTAITIKLLNDNFNFINLCFESSNLITEKIQFFKDIINWCQDSYEIKINDKKEKENSHTGKVDKEILNNYFCLIKQCTLKIFEHNEPLEIDRSIIVNILLTYIEKCLPTRVQSRQEIIKVFDLICLAHLLEVHEDIYYVFGPARLEQYFDFYIEEEMKKLKTSSQQNTIFELTRLFTHASNIDKIIFLPEDTNITLLDKICRRVIDSLSNVHDLMEYFNLFEWSKSKISKDFHEVEIALNNSKQAIQKKLRKKFKQIYKVIYNQKSFDKQIQLVLVYLSIVFDLKNEDELKKNILKHFCQAFLKKYSLISEHEKTLLLDLCTELQSVDEQDPDFYEILFTIIAVPTQTNSFSELITSEKLNFLSHRNTIKALFDKFLEKNTLDNFMRCLHIAKHLFICAPDFSKSLYLSIIKKFESRLFSTYNDQFLFEIIFNSLAEIDCDKLDSHKQQIIQSLVSHCKNIYHPKIHNDKIADFINNLNESCYYFPDRNIAFTFIIHIISFFKTRLSGHNFTEINRKLNDFFKVYFPLQGCESNQYTTAWTSWLRYTHRHFTNIFHDSKVEYLGDEKTFQSLFGNNDKLQAEAQYYCESLKELSNESVAPLIKKIESSINNDSLPFLPYACRDVLNYLIENQITQAISLFNSLLKDKRFEFVDRITYAYYIYKKIEELFPSTFKDESLKEKFNPNICIDFSNFFRETNCNEIPEYLMQLIILLDRRGNVEIKDKLVKFFDKKPLKIEDKIAFYTSLASQQWKEKLYESFQETIHLMIHSIKQEKSIKTELWNQIFDLTNLLNNANLNKEVAEALVSLPLEDKMYSALWLTALQKIENSTEFLSLLCDEIRVNFLLKLFEPFQSMHKDFCQYFIKQYIQAIDLLDKDRNKVESLTQVKSQIQQKFSHLKNEIFHLILELDLKIFTEKTNSNPDNFLPNLKEFLESYFIHLQDSPDHSFLHLTFDTLAKIPDFHESSSEEFKKLFLDKLSSLKNQPFKFEALLYLTNKFHEKKLLSSEDYNFIKDQIDSYLYEFLVNNINTNPKSKDDINSTEADKFFETAFIYTRYFEKNTDKIINIIKFLTFYSLKELQLIGKGRIFESRTRSILKIVNYNESKFCPAFLDVNIRFYYRNSSKQLSLLFRDFFNYVETNIENLETIDASKYWTLKILAGLPITKGPTTNKIVQKTILAVFKELISSSFLGFLKAIEILNNYNEFFNDKDLINLQIKLISKIKEKIASSKLDDEKKLIKKVLENFVLWLSHITSSRQFTLINQHNEIIKNTLTLLNQLTEQKFFNEEKNKYHRLIYILVELNIRLKDQYGLLSLDNFHETVKLLTLHPELYPVENSKKEIFGRMLMRYFKHTLMSIQRLKNEKEKETAFSFFWQQFPLLQNPQLSQIIESNPYTKESFGYLILQFLNKFSEK